MKGSHTLSEMTKKIYEIHYRWAIKQRRSHIFSFVIMKGSRILSKMTNKNLNGFHNNSLSQLIKWDTIAVNRAFSSHRASIKR